MSVLVAVSVRNTDILNGCVAVACCKVAVHGLLKFFYTLQRGRLARVLLKPNPRRHAVVSPGKSTHTTRSVAFFTKLARTAAGELLPSEHSSSPLSPSGSHACKITRRRRIRTSEHCPGKCFETRPSPAADSCRRRTGSADPQSVAAVRTCKQRGKEDL